MPGQTFTTYINAKRTGSVDAEFASLGAAANKSLSGIQRKAEDVNRALAGLTGGRGTAGRSPIGQAYLNGFDQAKMKADKLAEAQQRLARQNSTLVRSLRTTADTLQIVQGPLGPIAGRVSAAADAFTRLTGVTLGLAGAGAALFAYVKAANQFVEIRSKLNPLYDSQVQVNKALNDVFGIAQRSRAGLQPVVELYGRLKQATDALGFSQQRLGRLTELAAKAATLSGGSAQSREAGLYQFSQAIASNTLQGDELRSIKENLPALSRELSKGLAKLPEFKGVDTSIGSLKKLGEQGKLTADVIARALEQSANDIEARFAKLPPTIGTAFTSLGNNATMFVGRFEESTHIVQGLASAIMLVGNNLGQILGLVGGVASGFAAIAVAGKFKQITTSIGEWTAGMRAQQAAARQSLALAMDQSSAIARQTLALKAEEQQIRNNIVALEAELRVQQEIAAQGATAMRAGLAGGAQQLAAGQAGAKAATRELANEIEHLSVVQTQAATAGRALKTSNAAVGVAATAASKSSSLLRTAIGGVLGAINPLGIAVGLATTAFLEWAMSESQAEKNARKVEEAQRSLAAVIDFTTGKIIEQNKAILAGKESQTREALLAEQQTYTDVRQQIGRVSVLAPTASRFGGLPTAARQLSPSEQQAQRLVQQYGAGQGRADELIAKLQALAKADPSLRSFVDEVSKLGDQAVASARSVAKMQAQLGLLAGQTDEETRRRARGDFSGGAAQGQGARNLTAESEALAKKLSDQRFAALTQEREAFENLEKRKSQMSADDYVRERAQIINTYNTAIAAIGKREDAEEARRQRAHERELRRIEEENKKREERTTKRTDILGRYEDEPTPVIKAEKDLRTLNALVGQTMNGLADITKNNPLGQGIYTQAMADADAQRIQDGLQKPYLEYLRQRERDVQISGLLATGHELEAEALRQAFDFHDRIGKVTMDQYQTILGNVRAEEQMNDVLAQRERIMAPLKAAADNVRNSIVSAIEAIETGTNPFKAGKNFLKSLFSQFAQGNAVQLAEKITGGLDQRVRDLIRGSTSVDSKIADYLNALNKTSQGAEGLTGSFSKVATSAERAAAALDHIADQPTGVPGVGTAGGGASQAAAAAYSILGAKLPSSFYKSGVNVGTGVGDNIIYQALGGLGTITENLRSQSTQNKLFASGKTTARVSDHTTTQEAYDYRLPAGVSFSKATALIKKQAAEFGYAVVKALDETTAGGTGPHAHYVFGRASGSAAASTTAGTGAIGASSALIGGVPEGIITQAIKTISSLAHDLTHPKTAAAGEATVGPNGEITIHGVRPQARAGGTTAGDILFGTSTKDAYNAIGQQIGTNIDKMFGTNFAGKVGAQLGNALQGAQTGAMVAGLAKNIWGKFSTTGSEIGGAVGSVASQVTGIPGLDIVGSILGGTIGGLFKKTKKASVTISGSGGQINVGDAIGNSSKAKKASDQLGSSFSEALQQIADQLGATIGSFSVSIGQRHGDYRVDPTGSGKTKIKSGAIDFNDDAQAAIEYAIRDAIKDGALMGISAASKAILTKSKDLNTALTKAAVIESIPRRLQAIKDPVKAAIMDLNTEFSKMISYLKEGGATIEQFKEAQELYDLERQKAIEQATNQSVSQIQDYIDEMLGGSSSPFNKRTVYENAQAALQPLAADVQAGKVVDTDALLKAVSNFQNASQELNGSSSSFFDDFNYLVTLLNQAKTNVTGSNAGGTANLPPSPFDDASVQAIINGTQGTVDAINHQTDTLGGILRDVLARLRGMDSTSAIDLLAGSSGGGGGGNLYQNGALPQIF
jgi:tape measure domain-containing protein